MIINIEISARKDPSTWRKEQGVVKREITINIEGDDDPVIPAGFFDGIGVSVRSLCQTVVSEAANFKQEQS